MTCNDLQVSHSFFIIENDMKRNHNLPDSCEF